KRFMSFGGKNGAKIARKFDFGTKSRRFAAGTPLPVSTGFHLPIANQLVLLVLLYFFSGLINGSFFCQKAK
ncbi:MAG: hypothetical protein FWG03_03765, partial [Clostridiales bacterium]|nr:hypothetical protein [Clostridiales bacterium]